MAIWKNDEKYFHDISLYTKSIYFIEKNLYFFDYVSKKICLNGRMCGDLNGAVTE